MAVAQNPAYFEFRLSGGAGNTNPAASLGGIKSSQVFRSKSASGISNITGVTIDDAPGTATGAGTLAYANAAKTLTWTPSGGSAGAAVALTEDGRYMIPGSAGFLAVTVDYSELAGTDKSDTITISNVANALWDDISKTESWDGDTEYRCFYVHNAHGTSPFVEVKLYISSNTSGADDLSIALDLAGVGNGSTTGVADDIADEGTAPSPALTFTQPTSVGTALSIGTLTAGQSYAVWMKRVVSAQTVSGTASDLSTLTFSIGY